MDNILSIELKKIGVIQKNDLLFIIKNISLIVEQNSIVTIIGRNGTGKSTILKAIIKILDERFYTIEGNIFYNNIDLLTVSEEKLRVIREKHIKIVMQDAIHCFDPLKKIGYYFNLFKLNEEELKELLEELFLPPIKIIKNYYPHQLSGGMAQRLLFILAAASNPRLLLLDEPSSSLDAPIANALINQIKKFVSKGNSVLLVTQDIDFAFAVSDKICFLEKENLSKLYTINELLNPERDNEYPLLRKYKEMRYAER